MTSRISSARCASKFERDGFRVTAAATGQAALIALGLAPPPLP